MKPFLSIIYVYFNTPAEIIDSIATIRSGIGKIPYEVIIVDNASKKELPIEESKKIKIVRNTENKGYGSALNDGASIARGSIFLLVNSDILFAPHSIKNMLKILDDKKIGIVGPQVLSAKNTIDWTYSGSPLLPYSAIAFSFLNKIFPNNKYSTEYWQPNSDRKQSKFVKTIGGCCMMVSSKVFNQVNGFDERFFLFFEETDFCLKVRKAGYKIFYTADSNILHLGARSMNNIEKIQEYFERSRYLFYQKYHGTLKALAAEFLLRITKKNNLVLLMIISLSAFLNLFMLNKYMLFIGDSARDYLAAKDMLLNHSLPLVGIPSSVVWLFQGPLSIYIIGASFLVFRFNPVAPSITYGLIGVGATYLIYLLSKRFFNSKVGLLVSLLYATSPSVVINARMPYHTSSIPLFTMLMFFFLYKSIKEEGRYFFLLFLSFGLMLEVELSNVIFLPTILIVLLKNKINFNFKKTSNALFGLLLGVLPLFIYDINHNFLYSVKFPLWIINRTRLFFGIASNHRNVLNIQDTLFRITQQVVDTIYPQNLFVTIFIVGVSLIVFLTNRKKIFEIKSPLLILALWMTVPLVGYIIHSTPGPAYFPALYPVFIMIVGYAFYRIAKKNRFALIGLVSICLLNVCFLLNNQFYVTTLRKDNLLPPFSYSLGSAIEVSDDVARFIIKDSQKKAVTIIAGGFIQKFPTSVDPYKYLVWYRGGDVVTNGIIYKIYESKKQILSNEHIVYSNGSIYIVKP